MKQLLEIPVTQCQKGDLIVDWRYTTGKHTWWTDPPCTWLVNAAGDDAVLADNLIEFWTDEDGPVEVRVEREVP